MFTIRINRRNNGKDSGREVYSVTRYFVDRIEGRADAVQIIADGVGENLREGAKFYTIENEDRAFVMNATGHTVDSFDRHVFEDKYAGKKSLR